MLTKLLGNHLIEKSKTIINTMNSNHIHKELDYDKILKLTSDSLPKESGLKSVLTSITFILTEASKHNTSSEVLDGELQQLGLQKSSTKNLVSVYMELKEELIESLKRSSFRGSKLVLPTSGGITNVIVEGVNEESGENLESKVNGVDWEVDYVIASGGSNTIEKSMGEPCINMRLLVDDKPWLNSVLLPTNNSKNDSNSNSSGINPSRVIGFEMKQEKFDVLFRELKIARSMM